MGKKSSPKPMGRPPKEINWQVVEKCLEAGCSGVQTAAYLGVHHDTLYDAVVREHGVTFTQYSAEKASKGETMIALKQFQEAIVNGDKTLLIWLGKNRLGQRDSKDVNVLGSMNVEVVNYGDEDSKPWSNDNQ